MYLNIIPTPRVWESILTLIEVAVAVSSIINGSGDVPVYEFKLKPQYPKM